MNYYRQISYLELFSWVRMVANERGEACMHYNLFRFRLLYSTNPLYDVPYLHQRHTFNSAILQYFSMDSLGPSLAGLQAPQCPAPAPVPMFTLSAPLTTSCVGSSAPNESTRSTSTTSAYVVVSSVLRTCASTRGRYTYIYMACSQALCRLQIWNEQEYDTGYVKLLRSCLDRAGLAQVRIVVGDGDWSPADHFETDPVFANATYAIGFVLSAFVHNQYCKLVGPTVALLLLRPTVTHLLSTESESEHTVQAYVRVQRALPGHTVLDTRAAERQAALVLRGLQHQQRRRRRRLLGARIALFPFQLL